MKFSERGTAIAEKETSREIDCGTTDVAIQEGRTASTSDMEDRLGIDSLDVLHAKRRALVERSARLRALHGKDGLYDNVRKRLLEALKVRHRMELTQRDEKITEGYVDALAHADAQYESLIENGITDRIEWVKAENDLADVTERIQNRVMEISVYTSEARMR